MRKLTTLLLVGLCVGALPNGGPGHAREPKRSAFFIDQSGFPRRCHGRILCGGG